MPAKVLTDNGFSSSESEVEYVYKGDHVSPWIRVLYCNSYSKCYVTRRHLWLRSPVSRPLLQSSKRGHLFSPPLEPSSMKRPNAGRFYSLLSSRRIHASRKRTSRLQWWIGKSGAVMLIPLSRLWSNNDDHDWLCMKFIKLRIAEWKVLTFYIFRVNLRWWTVMSTAW